MPKYLFCFILLIHTMPALCQSELAVALQHIDSLRHSNTDSALLLLGQVKAISRNDSLKVRRMRANIVQDQGKLSEAKALNLRNLSSCTEADTFELAQAHNNIGLIYTNEGIHDSAAFHLLKSLEYRNLLTDSLLISQSLGNLGLLFSYQNDHKQAEDYHRQALNIKMKIGAPIRSTAISHLNLGLALGNQGIYDQEIQEYNLALKGFLSINDLKGVSMIYNNIAWTYQHKLSKPDSAEYYYLQALSLRKQVNNILGIAQTSTNLAELYMGQGFNRKAIEYLDESEKLAFASDSKREIYLVELNYARFLEGLADYQGALAKYKLADDYEDSLLNLESQERVYELQTKYETVQKEQEIASQKLELAEKESDIQAQRIQIGGLLAGFVILVLFGLIFYNQYRARQNERLQLAVLTEKERGFESVIQATEEERKRISKDLHDGIGQQLSALKMALSNLISKTSDEAQKEDLEIITDQFAKSAEEVRQVSHQMMPRTLMDFGLVNAIEDLLQNSFKFSDIKYEFEHRLNVERFEERIEISLYRVLQELINNIIKHSEASEVSVQLIQNKGKLLLFVEDNGKGMNSQNTDGHGLLNIKSRLDMVKGSVNYEPSPDSGTSATISIPLT